MNGGVRTLDLDLSGIRVRLEGPGDGVLDRFRADWEIWLGSPADCPDLVLEYHVSGDPPQDQTVLRKVLHLEESGDLISITTGEGRVDLDRQGRAQAAVSRGGDNFRFYAVQNLLLASLARILPDRGAMVIHGAGILMKGGAVALVGPEGAGKTTWSRIAGEAGAAILSDDLLFLRIEGDQVLALGSPYRADRAAPVGPGKWPLGMLLSAKHAALPEILPCSRLRFQALLSANLPFFSDRVGKDPRLDRLLDSVLDKVPFRTLAFAPEPSFMTVIGEALAGRPGR